MGTGIKAGWTTAAAAANHEANNTRTIRRPIGPSLPDRKQAAPPKADTTANITAHPSDWVIAVAPTGLTAINRPPSMGTVMASYRLSKSRNRKTPGRKPQHEETAPQSGA